MPTSKELEDLMWIWDKHPDWWKNGWVADKKNAWQNSNGYGYTINNSGLGYNFYYCVKK